MIKDENLKTDRPRSFHGAAADQNGKALRLGSDRALVLDLLHLARKVPAFPVERWFDLQEVAEARKASRRRISWITLFAKAYSLASLDVPELRRFYMSFPWPRSYQSRYTVVSVAINRKVDDQDRLLFGRLRWPEDKTLVDIQDELDGYVQADIDKVYRQQLLCSRVPQVLRLMGWWWRTNIQPAQRARRLGTGSISVLAGQGVMNRRHPCLLTSSLSYGPLQDDGRIWVTLQCDHRLIDGYAAARAINLMSDYLSGEILSELRSLGRECRAA